MNTVFSKKLSVSSIFTKCIFILWTADCRLMNLTSGLGVAPNKMLITD